MYAIKTNDKIHTHELRDTDIDNAKSAIAEYVREFGQDDYNTKTTNLEFGNVLKFSLRCKEFPRNASNAYAKAVELFALVRDVLPSVPTLFDNACLPGDFIRAAERAWPGVDWVASSINTGLDDRFDLIKNNPKRWLCGDNSGDIMDDAVFAKLSKRKVDLFTSDLGFAMGHYDEEATHAPFNVRQIALGLCVEPEALIVKAFGCGDARNCQAIINLCENYRDVIIVKPLTSKADNAECYYVARTRVRSTVDAPAIERACIAVNSQLLNNQAKKIHDNISIIGKTVDYSLLMKYWRKRYLNSA